MNDAGARYARGLRRYLTLGGLAWEWKDDMTEQDWLASEDPDRMVAWLCEPVQVSCPVCGGSGDCGGGVGLPRYCGTCHGTGETCPPGWVYVGDRKLRLFACACCRAAWPLPAAEGCRLALDVAERYADGLVTEVDRGRAHADACRRASVPGTSRLPPLLLRTPAVFDARALAGVLDGTRGAGLAPATQAALLRDVIGDPFRPVPPAPRRWLTPAVRGIAGRAYDLRDWGALPILADALQEAGCEDEDVLMHCRGKGRCPDCLGKGGCCDLKDEAGIWGDMHRCFPCVGSGRVDSGPHVRGCWCVDMLIGKS
jgi:hypothetical protein